MLNDSGRTDIENPQVLNKAGKVAMRIATYVKSARITGPFGRAPIAKSSLIIWSRIR